MKHLKLRALLLALLAVLAVLAACPQIVFAQSEERLLYASVVDKDGAPVPDLTEKDFIVREDGQAREVLRVVPDRDPFQIALLVDTGEKMQSHINDLRRAVNAFIDNTREGVQIALITLGARPTISVSYTADHAALKKGADRLFTESDSGNTLLDGIAETAEGFVKRSVLRSAIAAISAPEDLSFRHYEDVLAKLRGSGAVLHVLTLGTAIGDVDRELAVSKGTEETGGRNETVLSSMGLIPEAEQLAKVISSQYRITFGRPPRLVPPKTTEVSVKDPDLKAHGLLLKTEKERP